MRALLWLLELPERLLGPFLDRLAALAWPGDDNDEPPMGPPALPA